MKYFIIFFSVILLVCSSGCSKEEDGSNKDLRFVISDAKALFAGPPIVSTNRTKGEGNNILLKENNDGEIEEAVVNIRHQFVITYMLNNPVTKELFLFGYLHGYRLIRVDDSDNHYGLSADDYHYYSNSGFDSEGAFYFETSSGTIGKPKQLWKYSGNTATSLAESQDFISLHKVMYNGYIIYSIQDGDTWLRAPSGGLTAWEGGTSGVYSSFSDTFYYDDKGYRFDTKTEFDTGVTITGKGDDFDATDDSFIVVSDSSIVSYMIQNDKTLSETVLLDNYTIDSRNVDNYGKVFLIKQVGNDFYFVGKDPSGDRNIFKLTGVDTVQKLLTGSDDNGFLISTASFDKKGRVAASAQHLSRGKYGVLTGDFSTGDYEFTERDNFNSVTDVLLNPQEEIE